jgi:hypothetical protein
MCAHIGQTLAILGSVEEPRRAAQRHARHHLHHVMDTAGAYAGVLRTSRFQAAENRGMRERALRFDRLCYRALAEGLISLGKGAELLRVPVSQVEADLKGPQGADADHRQ